MSKVHYDPERGADQAIYLAGAAPLHGTAYAGGVNGLEVSGDPADVDCAVCWRKMQFLELPPYCNPTVEHPRCSFECPWPVMMEVKAR